MVSIYDIISLIYFIIKLYHLTCNILRQMYANVINEGKVKFSKTQKRFQIDAC